MDPEPLVKAFRALRFDTGVAGSLDELVAPPWDVISEEALDGLSARSPFNVIRLIRPHEPELAARRLAEWSEAGVLVREPSPAVWRSEESFVGPDGVPRSRHGLVLRVRLVPYERGVVLPHERIFAGPAETRLRLIRATRAKLSPVLILHDGPAAPAIAGEPDLEARLGGVTTRLWRLGGERMREALATVRAPLVIADGHHRYDAALRYHAERGGEESGYVLATVISHEDPGLTIYPTHRVAADAVPVPNGDFSVRSVGSAAEGLALLAGLPRDHPGFVVVRRDGSLLAELGREDDPVARLDVAALERLRLEDVTFTPFAREAEAAVESGRAGAAFLVRAPTVGEVQAIALAGRTMPEKSTYFFPKAPTGLVLRPLDAPP